MVFGPLSFGRLSGVPISGNCSQPVSLLEPSPSAVSESVDVDERRVFGLLYRPLAVFGLFTDLKLSTCLGLVGLACASSVRRASDSLERFYFLL